VTRKVKKGDHTLNQLVFLGPFLQVLLQTVCSTLTVEVLADGLEGSEIESTIISFRDYPESSMGTPTELHWYPAGYGGS
jgi:hypothetical protein